MAYDIKTHLRYNVWANGKVVEILSNLDEQLFDKEMASSFPTIRKTVFHVWDAEKIWLERLKGGDISTWPSQNFTGNTADMLNGFLENSKAMAAFVDGLSTEQLNSSIHYKNMKGLEFTNQVEHILFHVVNHGSFHRGQLITMLRNAGVTKFPPQDLIAYIREL